MYSSDTNTIVGNMGNIDLNLNVTKVLTIKNVVDDI